MLPAALVACSPAGSLNATISTSGIDITHDAVFEPGPRGTLDIYRPSASVRPATATGLPLIIFLYGGSWRMGDKSTYPFVGATLARRGAVVMIPNYRMFPQVVFPAFLDDNAAAVAWAIGHAAEYGADPRQTFIIGHSAGAYDAAMLALDPHWLAMAGVDRAALRGVVGMAGPYNFLPITDPDIIPVFAPVQDGPASQPITYVDGHNPPMLLVAGDADTTVNPQNTISLAKRITEAGGPVVDKIYPGVGHIGLILSFAPLFRSKGPVLEDVWNFVAAHRTGLDASQALR